MDIIFLYIIFNKKSLYYISRSYSFSETALFENLILAVNFVDNASLT